MFGVCCAVAHHFRNRILAIHIHPKQRIIRIYRIADAKHGFYRSHKFSNFYAFELGMKPDENEKDQLTITYHSRYETGDISPMMSEKNVQELYRYLNWVVLNKSV